MIEREDSVVCMWPIGGAVLGFLSDGETSCGFVKHTVLALTLSVPFQPCSPQVTSITIKGSGVLNLEILKEM